MRAYLIGNFAENSLSRRPEQREKLFSRNLKKGVDKEIDKRYYVKAVAQHKTSGSKTATAP